jgi:outer membrane protein OmpA-like peptidoglycan-associated protein
MTRTLALGAFAASLLAATPVLAQTQLYPGQGITVNPGAIYGRPGGNYPGVIQLHMPTPKKRHVAKKKAAPSSAEVGDALLAAQQQSDTTAEPASPPPAKPKVAKKVEAPQPAPEENTEEEAGGIPLSLAPEEPHPIHQPKPQKPMKTASVTPPPAAAAPSQTSNIVAAQQTPGKKSTLSKRSEILFPRGATDPGTETINKLRSVASELNTLLGAGAARVQLEAYGGAPGDKSSDARRLSLKRALVIRQILIEDGVPSERIDVRAMGGIDDSGAPDRVDVFVNAG